MHADTKLPVVAGEPPLAPQRRLWPALRDALLFLYRVVLDMELPWLDGLVRAKSANSLPTVLTRDEIQAVLARLSGTRGLSANLLYGAGLRLDACLSLLRRPPALFFMILLGMVLAYLTAIEFAKRWFYSRYSAGSSGQRRRPPLHNLISSAAPYCVRVVRPDKPP